MASKTDAGMNGLFYGYILTWEYVLDAHSSGVGSANSPEVDYLMDEVRTLFVSGLPSDVKQRELNLLFRPYKGKYLLWWKNVVQRL